MITLQHLGFFDTFPPGRKYDNDLAHSVYVYLIARVTQSEPPVPSS